ncbi:MAG: ATP-dependent helicase [Actinomycetota bacterium]
MSDPRPDERPYADAPKEVVAALGGVAPTFQQWRAISHPPAPGAVVAGAGSGKTAVMAARVVYLALAATGAVPADHGGAMPSRVLCLTFTNKAAEELSRRVLRAVAGLGLPEGEEPTVLTYHAFAATLIRDYGLRMGVEPGQQLLSEAQKWQLMGSLLDDREFEAYEVRSDYIVGEALQLADQVANHLVDPREVVRLTRELAESAELAREKEPQIRAAVAKRLELAGLVAAYEARKRELGYIDYGDQISLAFDLVRGHPEVAGEFRDRYRAVLLDEYQDTNSAQARLLQELCGTGAAVTAVGDPDQNIYAWRGASLQNILRFEDDFGATGGASLPLYVNFRSGSRILEVANAVIEEVPPERRAADKVLRPHPDRGEGRVLAFVAADDRAEGRHIARLIRDLRDERGLRWQDFAVLCRKRKLFAAIAEALREADVPAEVVDLGGLLKMPEVVEVVAWLHLLEDPGRNIDLARLLQGPRWRIGYRDLRAMAQWASRRNRELEGAITSEEDLPGDVIFALAEALEHTDDPDMEGLSDEARERLRGFAVLLAGLREAAKGSLEDLVEAVIDRSGLWAELDASREESATGARRNLLNLIQHISSFSPVDGEASLSTLIEYLDTAQQTEDDLEPAQPSESDTVKLLTIHKAKGLEWPVVFVPGLAEHKRYGSSLFPDASRGPNPLTRPATLPFELRGDRDVLPRYDGDLKAFKKELAARGHEEERRLCYVALTRARDVLVASAAHWYEGPSEPHFPGRFLAAVARHDASEVLFEEECPDESPVVEARRARVPRWPLRARPDDADELFPEGWRAAAARATEDPASVKPRLEALEAGEAAELGRILRADLERAGRIRERLQPEPGPAAPTTLSVSGLIAYAKCPKLFYWSQVRPLPRRPSQAARLGSEVHRWIELQSRGQATLLDVDDLPDLSTEERLGEPGKEQALREAFRASRFSGVTPLYAERPFLLYLGGMVVGGRIDAIFGQPDGPWEVVDYKTGRVPPDDDPLSGFQLDLYALACTEIWGKRAEDLTLTYLYLAEGKEVTRGAGDVAEVRERVVRALKGVAAGRFDPTPGDQCRWCDFLSFCSAGQAHLDGGS